MNSIFFKSFLSSLIFSRWHSFSAGVCSLSLLCRTSRPSFASMAFCTYVTEKRRSLQVQIQLAVTPGPRHTQCLTYKPAKPRPPPYRGIFDCAIWRKISLLWLQWQKNAHYIDQIARECSEKKKNKKKKREPPTSVKCSSYSMLQQWSTNFIFFILLVGN